MTVTIMVGDVREKLRTLAADSVHCVVTSPPYWGLRDYGVDGQIGLEASPAEFIATMVEVFEEVRRVLRPDGTCWVNMGDSYATSGGSPTTDRRAGVPSGWTNRAQDFRTRPSGNLKPKDLCMMPHRLAIALQDAGWWVRQDIVWHKPNPMPESIKDRCTKGHEYIFLLAKSERYFFDAAAIAEPTDWDASDTKMPDGWDTGDGGDGSFHREGREKGRKSHVPGNKTHKGTTAYEEGAEEHRTKAGLVAYAERERSKRNSFARVTKDSAGEHGQKPQFRLEREQVDYTGTRNKRSVWTIATKPFKEAHFATFPPELAETCIKAGCPPGGMVLDPFFGAGTTGLVADRLQRDCIGIELNPAYAEIARKRIQGDSTLFSQVEVAA